MKLHRPVLVLAIGVLFVSVIAGLVPIDAGVAQTPAQEADEIKITLILDDIRFEPNVIEVPANQPVILHIENIGAAKHSFVVPDLGIDVQVQPGRFGEITIRALPGEYEFICTVPGHKEAGMVGTLRVISGMEVDASPAPATVENATPVPASPAAVLDDPGCEGLPGYSQQVLAIETDAWNQLVAEFGIDEDSDLLLLEEEQFADLSMMLDSEMELLMQVEAPGFAEDWHRYMIASVQLAATTVRMVPQAGSPFAARVQLWEVSEALDAQEQQAYLEALTACPAFETFWSELSLIDGDAGTPPDATSDYSNCAGLAPYDSNYRRAHAQAFANRPELASAYLALSLESDDDLRAKTPTELLMLAAMFMEFGGEIAKVSPPDYAAEWHLSQIMYYGAIADLLKAAAALGFETAEAEFSDELGLAALFVDAAAEKAAEECSVFAEFAVS